MLNSHINQLNRMTFPEYKMFDSMYIISIYKYVYINVIGGFSISIRFKEQPITIGFVYG